MDTLPVWAWIAFGVFVVAMLAIDLGVFHRHSHAVRMREALSWCAVWVTLAMVFNAIVWWWRGPQAALEFFTGYLVELCLSVDNVFVFILVFAYFRVEPKYQHRVLFWGIIGAAVMRGTFIFAGIALLNKLEWLILVLGAFLVVTGLRMLRGKHEEVHPEKNPVVKLFRRFFPVAPNYDSGRFFTRVQGSLMATPLFIVLIVVETTDLVFAVDSIPAILAITRDAFIVFTSNIFAILGLRALYFALSGVMQLFRFLGTGLAVVLVFIGTKMLLSFWEIHVPIGVSLGVIATVLAVAVGASFLWPAKSGKIDTPPES